jgi:cyclic pyranopterin monophosphate synthase
MASSDSPLTHFDLQEFEIDRGANYMHCSAQAEAFGRAGVEMEALTAVHAGLLAAYDRCKAAHRSMVMADIRLLERNGGKSGRWVATAPEDAQ